MNNNNDIRGLIQRLRKFRLSKGLTLKKMAILIDLKSPTAVRNLENGNTKRPHDTTIYKIKELLGEL